MTKKQKIDYINAVNDRFTCARNHGNGNNWWYPKPNRIAYNVKLHGQNGGGVDDLRKLLTARQNDYYSDDMKLSDIISERIADDACMFSDNLDVEYSVTSGYAGRSGGWLEVDYANNLTECDETMHSDDINNYYKDAKKLEALESKIAAHIKSSLSGYIKYLNSPDFCKDIADSLLDDDMIADEYKGRIKTITDKLK